MSTDTRDKRAIEAIRCPQCLAPAGTPCSGNFQVGRPACHSERRALWRETKPREAGAEDYERAAAGQEDQYVLDLQAQNKQLLGLLADVERTFFVSRRNTRHLLLMKRIRETLTKARGEHEPHP